MASQQDIARVQSLFPRSPIWDAETQRIVDGIRAYLYRKPEPTITEIQQSSVKARAIPQGCYCVREVVRMPAQDDARRLFHSATAALGEFDQRPANAVPVPMEWVGVNYDSSNDSSGQHTPRERLAGMKPHACSNGTVFHVHGGNLFQGSTASYRSITSRLAKLTSAQVVSVDYRLSPQHQLPAALLDVFMAYLSVMYPPAQAQRAPIDPSTIVFTGDSSGGVLLLCLLLIVQQMPSSGSFRFHSHVIDLPLPRPAGISMFSPVGDMLQAMPSRLRNRVHDLFIEPPWMSASYPSCPIWPTEPQSPMLYCNKPGNLSHPLVAPCIWNSWADFPPMWFGAGHELFYDGAKAIARKAAQQGVQVTWLEFEAMPHCFFMQPGLSRSRQSSIIYEKWASFYRDCLAKSNNIGVQPKGAQVSMVSFQEANEEDILLEQPHDPPLDMIESLVRARVADIQSKFELERPDYRNTKL